MTPAPPAEFQVAFLQKVQRILAEGSFVATYKFALLHALADLAVLRGDRGGGEVRLSTFEIAEKFAELYWRQTVPFPGARGAADPLRQNTGRQAAVVQRIEQFRRDEERRRERERVAFLTELAAQYAKATQLRDFLAACKELPDRGDAADRWIAWGETVLAEIDPLADGLAPVLAARPAYGPPLFAAITGEAAGDP